MIRAARRARPGLLAFFLRRIARIDTVARVAEFSIRRYKNRTFIIDPEREQTLTFEEFALRAREAAAALAGLGLARGDVFAFRDASSGSYFAYRLACHRLGITFMALPAALEENTVESLIAHAGAKAVYGGGRLVALSAGENVGARAHRLPRPESSRRPGIATLNVSSGTTVPVPKIVGLTEGNWIESLYGYLRSSEESPNATTTFLCTLPLAAAGSTTFLPSLLGGITYVVVGENPGPASIVEYVRRYGVNQLYLTPHRLFELAEFCAVNRVSLPLLRKIITGTERAPAARLREAIDAFGPIVHVGYGMVEALPPLSMLGPRDYRKLGSVGRPLGGVDIRIGKDGKIVVRTKTVGAGYLNYPEESAARFRDGRFFTDDYGHRDGEGFLYVLGRKEEIVARKPRRIFAAEIEDALYAIPTVRRCAAVSKDDEVTVFVSLRGRCPISELQGAAHRIVDCRVVLRDDIPINGLGKLDRRALSTESSLC